MLLYLVKRLFFFIPTLIAISLLAFGMSQCTPGDPVESRLPESDRQVTSSNYEQAYRKAAQEIGADLPVFYGAIQVRAIPDTFHRIWYQPHRKNLRKMVMQTGNWPATQAYYEALKEADRRIKGIDPNYRSDAQIEIKSRIELLYSRYQVPAIESLLDTIVAAAQRDSLIQAQAGSELGVLQQRFADWRDQSLRAELFIPSFRWFGLKNQYQKWLSNLLRGDLGFSYKDDQPVVDVIKDALRWTLLINTVAIFIAYLISIPIGVYSAVYLGSRFDRWTSLFLFLLYSLPSFWLATMLAHFFTTPDWLNWFPSMGVGEVGPDASWLEIIRIRAHHLFLPIFCTFYGSLAILSRYVRGGMLEVIQSDYIRTAKAKGLSQHQVIWKHAFRNGLFPLITLIAVILPASITGSVIIENIFNIPGLGYQLLAAINSQNWPIVYALLMLTAVLTVLGLLIADILYALADPRVSFSHSSNARS